MDASEILEHWQQLNTALARLVGYCILDSVDLACQVQS